LRAEEHEIAEREVIVAVTPSTMLPLGTEAPEFRLPDAVSGELVSLRDFEQAPVLVVMFICNHCPFVVHVRPELGRLARDHQSRGVAFVAINSNDVEKYPQDAPERMKALVEELGWQFPFLFDEAQDVAKAFRAACTPDFFVFDAERKLVYRGQLDASRPEGDVELTGADLRRAIELALTGAPPSSDKVPSIGCNIKWKPGNEPEYFG
jgi:peroxiredoxin